MGQAGHKCSSWRWVRLVTKIPSVAARDGSGRSQVLSVAVGDGSGWSQVPSVAARDGSDWLQVGMGQAGHKLEMGQAGQV